MLSFIKYWTLPGEAAPRSFVAQSNYLAQQAGKVHLFRQRVAIPNVDPSAYR